MSICSVLLGTTIIYLYGIFEHLLLPSLCSLALLIQVRLSRRKEGNSIFNFMDVIHFLFGIFGNAFTLFLFLAPVITFKRIIVSKSTEKFSGIPYVMSLLNCFLSAWYGLPFVSPHNILVSTINGTRAVIEIIYVLIFILFAPKK